MFSCKINENEEVILASISRICAWKLRQYDRVEAMVGQMGDQSDLSLNFESLIYPLWDSVSQIVSRVNNIYLSKFLWR